MASIEKLLSGRLLLAPLAGITNLPFRLMARRFGCDLCFTEMISSNGLVRESEKTLEYLTTTSEDRPLGVQLFGADPEIMAAAASIVARQNPDIIDINMGCPVRKVVKSGSGAALMTDPALAGRIVAAVVKAVDCPVTVKIRSGWRPGSINAPEVARIAQDAGAAAVIVHGRTADQGFSGHADWSVIAQVKKTVQIPVVGNGDVRQPQDAGRMLLQTCCDAVMIGRGALGNPWIFQGIKNLAQKGTAIASPSLAQRLDIINEHWDMEARLYGDRIASRSFRKHLLWYTKGLQGSGRFRETVGRMSGRQAMLSELDRYFASLDVVPAEIMT